MYQAKPACLEALQFPVVFRFIFDCSSSHSYVSLPVAATCAATDLGKTPTVDFIELFIYAETAAVQEAQACACQALMQASRQGSLTEFPEAQARARREATGTWER